MSQRRIVITGVSRGLGRAMTEEFIRLGHTVIGCARSRAAIAELCGRFSNPHRFDVVDVVDESRVQGRLLLRLSTGGTTLRFPFAETWRSRSCVRRVAIQPCRPPLSASPAGFALPIMNWHGAPSLEPVEP